MIYSTNGSAFQHEDPENSSFSAHHHSQSARPRSSFRTWACPLIALCALFISILTFGIQGLAWTGLAVAIITTIGWVASFSYSTSGMRRRTHSIWSGIAIVSIAACTACSASATDVEVQTTDSSPSASSPSTLPSTTPAPQASKTPEAAEFVSPDADLGSLNVTDAAAVRSVLATLPIKGRAPKTGYSRAQFGQKWNDQDKNGCDTRNDILNRDLTQVTYKPGTHDCVVLTGVLQDPYTAKEIHFERGPSSSAVQIDHVVALSNAWQTGAQQLSPETRLAFANDPINLKAVDGPANQQKSDADAATWLPPNKPFRCEYVSLQVRVKAKYQLWVTQAEHDAIDNLLANCSTSGVSAPEPAAPVPPAAPAPAKDVYYKNCTAARAAGAAPIYQGQPGYRPALDRDQDGIACE